MRTSHAIVLASLSAFAADVAHADEPAPATPPASSAAPPASPDPVEAEVAHIRSHPVSIRSGLHFFGGTVRSTHMIRADVSLGIGVDVSRYLTLYSDVRFGTTRFHYEGSLDDGLTVRGTVWSYFDTSLAGGAEIHALRTPMFELDVNGEFEVSFARTSPSVTELTMTTDQGTYDIGPYARDNTDIGLFWHRLSLGPTFRMRFGPVMPSLGFAFEHVRGTMDLALTPDGRTVVTRLDYDVAEIERAHEASFSYVTVTPGLGFRMGPNDRLTAAGTFVPGDWHYGGSLRYVHRF